MENRPTKACAVALNIPSVLRITYHVLRYHMSPGYKHVAPLGLNAAQLVAWSLVRGNRGWKPLPPECGTIGGMVAIVGSRQLPLSLLLIL